MKTIVLDTSCFVSALLGSGGASREVLRLCLNRQLSPLMGNALYSEYESLLNRPALWNKSRTTESEREQLLNALLSTTRWVEIYYLWRPNLPDESDNHLVELAMAGGASHIITKNIKDVGRGELKFDHLTICKPEDYIREIRQ
ncbi:putative toxin-antitoxin system toxin component, PIN family [Endozoicomonas sp. 4G]|uniref:putative toxin-antitoxin system toxin component, PIN family n=1 Tax=Endozoicomonas sp. 4G TaxID=2872754 RepID=UPI002078D496|nr:putative toxin-antitoxin system toxin component, PIN family [Endozoicomonas sp. 4G]